MPLKFIDGLLVHIFGAYQHLLYRWHFKNRFDAYPLNKSKAACTLLKGPTWQHQDRNY